MSAAVTRVVLAVLAFTAMVVGVWATIAPRSFYDDFPGAGRTWVASDGPYNEHLVRDVGELNLALLVVTAFAFVTLTRALVLATALAWLAYGVPHFVYHLRNLDPFSGDDVVTIPVSLAFGVVAAVLLLLPVRPARDLERVERA